MNNALLKLVGFLFDHVVQQKFLAGKRSYVAGFASILGSVVIALNMVASGHFDEIQAGTAYAGFVLGEKIIGDAGKRDKLLAAQAAAKE